MFVCVFLFFNLDYIKHTSFSLGLIKFSNSDSDFRFINLLMCQSSRLGFRVFKVQIIRLVSSVSEIRIHSSAFIPAQIFKVLVHITSIFHASTLTSAIMTLTQEHWTLRLNDLEKDHSALWTCLFHISTSSCSLIHESLIQVATCFISTNTLEAPVLLPTGWDSALLVT